MIRAIQIPELETDPKERRYLFLGYAALRRIANKTGHALTASLRSLYNPQEDGSFAINADLMTTFIWAALSRVHPRNPEQPIWIGASEDDVAHAIDQYVSQGVFHEREVQLLMRVFEAAYAAGILPKTDPVPDEEGDDQEKDPTPPATDPSN